jgi:hypothetical protein
MSIVPEKNSLKMDDPFHFQIICANKLVDAAMQDEGFKRVLDEKKKEALMTGGFSRCGDLKSKYSIPQDAFLCLPIEIQDDDKAMDEWVITHHPYLIIANWKSKRGERTHKPLKLERR